MLLHNLPTQRWQSGDERILGPFQLSDLARSVKISLSPFESVEKLSFLAELQILTEGFWQEAGSFGAGQRLKKDQANFARIGMYPGAGRKIRVVLKSFSRVETGVKVENAVTVGTPASAAGFGASGSVAVDAGAGSNRLMVGCVCFDTGGVDAPVLAYNSSAMADIAFRTSTNNWTQMEAQIAPATGSHTLAWSASSGSYSWLLVGVPMAGVHQATPTGTAVTAFSDSGTTNPTATVTDSVAGDMVIDVVSKTNILGVLVVGADQTERVNSTSYGGSNRNGGVSTQPGAAGSLVMDWTTGVVSSDWAQIAVAVKQAASAVVSRVPLIQLLGVS